MVAAGVVPIAHAADGGGSIRIPAGACGLVGLKVSRGRLLQASKFKRQPVEIAIDGVVSRSVRDTAHFYAVCGIVEDSDPKNEWLETELKFKPMVDAVRIATRVQESPPLEKHYAKDPIL